MANNCFFHLAIECATENDSQKLHGLIGRIKANADAQNIGFAIGCERYMFDTELRIEGRTVLLDGWVKWGFADSEVNGLFDGIELASGPAEITMDYEEFGCLLYGCFSRSNGATTHRYLPTDKFPDCDEWDIYEEGVEAAYREHAVEVGI